MEGTDSPMLVFVGDRRTHRAGTTTSAEGSLHHNREKYKLDADGTVSIAVIDKKDPKFQETLFKGHKTTWSEYSAFWKCVQAGTAYLFTQLCKMMILATFFPTSEGGVNHLDIMGEFMKSTVDLGDLIGFYFILNSISAKGELKFLVAGVGWATAELVMTRVVPMWIGARGTEFDWKYIQLSLESNVNLVQHISTAALVWLWSRHDLNKSVQPLVVTLLALSSYKPLVVEILIHAAGLGSWTLLLAKSLYTFGVGFVALQLYVGLQGTANHYTK